MSPTTTWDVVGLSDAVQHPSRRGPAPTWRALRARVAAHPLVVVGLVTALVALGQAVWLWNHRQLGGIDPDESGYLATALRYQRSLDLLHPGAFVHEVGGTGTGPLVPLLSLPLLLIGPRDIRTAMLILPILVVVGSVFVAGTARHLAGAGAAVAAGIAWSVLPTVLLATQTYWLGLGTATCAAGATYMLVTSEQGTNRRIWWFGFLVGCMLLARTMALAFVPGFVVAALVIAGRDRRRLTRVAASGLVAFAVAGPWWIVEWSTIFDYLLGYGYGPRAGLFGNGNVVERLGFRLGRIADGVGRPLWTVTTITSVVGALILTARWRTDRTSSPARSHLAVALIAAFGIAGLVSTSNNGVWFELPMIALLVPLGASLSTRLPRPVALVCLVPLVGMTLVQLPVVWWWAPPTTRGIGFVAESQLHGAQYEAGFAQYDPRFASDRRDEQSEAATAWWDCNLAIADEMRRLQADDPDTVFTLSGNMVLVNSNTVTLAAELDDWGVRVSIPDTTRSSPQRRRDLTPEAEDGSRRVLVLALHDRILFTPDAEVADFARQARAAGWTVAHRIAMPGQGEVQFLTPPHRGGS